MQSKRECAGVTFLVNSCKVDVHPTTLFGGDARYCLPKWEHQALPKNFFEDVIKRLILAWLSKLLVLIFYCLLKRKQYCKYFPSENTNKQLVISAVELTTSPPSDFWH